MSTSSKSSKNRPPVDHETTPKKRLLERGPEALTDSELLAVALRLRGRSNRFDGLLSESYGLAGLVQFDFQTLRQRGFAESQALVLTAVAEIARRQARQDMGDHFVIDRPEEVVRYLQLRYGEPDQEIMGALYLDMGNRVLGESVPFRGRLTRISVEPRALLRRALTLHAAGIVLFHTHAGGGSPEPSSEDRLFTTRVNEACRTVGVRLVDHIVVGHGGAHVSFQARGLLRK